MFGILSKLPLLSRRIYEAVHSGQKHQLLDRMAGRQVLRIESILERKVGEWWKKPPESLERGGEEVYL